MFRIEALNKNDMFNTPFYLIISRKVAGKVMELALKIKGQLDFSDIGMEKEPLEDETEETEEEQAEVLDFRRHG